MSTALLERPPSFEDLASGTRRSVGWTVAAHSAGKRTRYGGLTLDELDHRRMGGPAVRRYRQLPGVWRDDGSASHGGSR